MPNGLKIPGTIRNLETEGNRRYSKLRELVVKEVQSANKGANRPSKGTASAKSSKPKPAKPVASTSKVNHSLGTKQSLPKTPGGSGSKKRGRSPGDTGKKLPSKRVRRE